ncbi:MAG: hypothetical protein GF333_07025 [Candidatus Omnitrophica bacterium]|nr:hypothetical protein [Candidatus Omnitrophota bacterium]
MSEVRQDRSSISLMRVFAQSWELLKGNVLLFFGIALLGHSLGLLDAAAVILSPRVSVFVSLLTGPAGFFIFMWAYIALVIAVDRRHSGRDITWKECFVQTKGRYWRFIGIYLLYFLIVLAGGLFFVIPGIYLAIIFWVSVVAAVLEKCSSIGPFATSKTLVRGSFWKIFLLGVLMTVCVAPFYLILFGIMKVNQSAGALCIQLYSMAYVTVVIVIDVVLYRQLKEHKGIEFPAIPEGGRRRGRGCMGCLIALGLAGLIFLIGVTGIFGIVKYSRTEKGAKVLESLKEKFSAEITFPGGASLERPRGTFVIKGGSPGAGKGTAVKYTVFLFPGEENGIKLLYLYAFPLETLNAAQRPQLGAGPIARALRKEWFQKNAELMRKRVGELKDVSVNKVRIKGRPWGEYILAAQKETSAEQIRYHRWKMYYTYTDEHLLCAVYVLHSRTPAARSDPDLLRAESLVKKLIANIRFPR